MLDFALSLVKLFTFLVEIYWKEKETHIHFD